MTDARADNRTRWGRVKFAGGRTPAMAVAIPAGLLTAAGFGSLTLLTDVVPRDHALLVAGVTAFVMSWGCIGLVWALVVDRRTLRGAIDKPEQSVESQWLESAQSGALTDLILMTGLALAVLSLARIRIDGTWALIGVIVIAGLSVGVRYLVARARG
ncbi:hypothetical protein [Microbacterium sp. Marseille-Q6965]|uniref:hypothetical protein n=1 Tax=Microbacterium sp. Marseille-Q6965 TaxID=2965072 RepID=UPI0021B7076B|nr:hypothetical protein [Microbacterium sp. Marseille-Q6965]